MSLPPTCGSMKDLPLGALISVHFNPSLLVANCRPAWPLGSRKKEKRKEELESDARTDREKRRKRSGAMKSEGRNPKSERSPKSEIRKVGGVRAWTLFRISGFGFLSDFGFRISDFIFISLLPIRRTRSVFAEKMFGEQRGLHRLHVGIDAQRFTREVGDEFEHDGVVHGVVSVFAPGKRTMARDKYG